MTAIPYIAYSSNDHLIFQNCMGFFGIEYRQFLSHFEQDKENYSKYLRLTFHHEQVSQVLLRLPLVGVATLLECLVVVVVGGGQLLEGGLVECSCFVRSREIRALKHHGHQIYTSNVPYNWVFLMHLQQFFAFLFFANFELMTMKIT